MKSKKITAWILLTAMLLTILPSTFVFAATDGAAVLSTASMTRDAIEAVTGKGFKVENGTDFPLLNNGNAGVFDSSVTDITYFRRTQDIIIKAESADGQFYDADGNVPEGTLKIAYKDVSGQLLKLDETNGFELRPLNAGEDAWIEIHPDPSICDAQVTIYNLGKFWTEAEPSDKFKLTASEIATADHLITAHLFNALGDQFAGYISIKAVDSNGKEHVTDYPVVADGQYPSSTISTVTTKHNYGEYNVGTLPTVENTFIASTDFEDAFDYEKYIDDAGNTMHPYVSLRHPEVNKVDLKKALQHADESVWTMNDITIESITVMDEEVTSGIADVKYYIDNIPDVNNVDVEVAHTGAEVNITGDLVYDATKKKWDYNTPITISDEGMTILTLVVEDNAGLVKTDRYYFFIDKQAPEAKFNLVELDKNVISLLTVADVDVVTNRQQALNMEDSFDAKLAGVTFVSELRAKDDAGNNIVVPSDTRYQYRLLATKAGEAAKDTDGDGVDDVPADYTDVVVDKKGNDLSGWKIWTGETETPVIDKEFDGIIQVRVQDRAGNWSPIISNVSTDSDDKTTIITDNTNPVIAVKEYALDTNADATGNTAAEITTGTAADILVHSGATEKTNGAIENEVIHTTTGDVAPWINDSAVLEVKITDEDLANEIRSSGLDKGQINVKAEFNAENENKEIKIWNKNEVDKKEVNDSFDLTNEYLFGTETDKDLTFYIEYEGTGAVDITVSVKDQADVNDGDVFSAIYKTQLRVDKINPYILYKGYDITDNAEKDLLKENHEKVDYEVRDMPWGPNSQVLEVVVKDDDVTSVQSGTANIKFNADKALDLYKADGDAFTKIKTYAAGSNHSVALSDCETLANDEYETNVGYKFYLVYEGTGIAKVEFFADDKATEPNVREYPSVATAADAEPVLYDAMLRVDKINPEIKNAKLVETDKDVDDKGWLLNLFSFNDTDVDVNTRKQMKVEFEIVDNNSANDTFDGANSEQSGVNIQNEKFLGVDLIDVYDNYVEKGKKHLYDNKATSYATDDANDKTVDPHIDYILLPVEKGEINGTGGKFAGAASASNKDIEALVEKYLGKEYNADGDKCEWKKASWEDGDIVIPDEFQGAIVLRTIDRVGNIDYSEPITFVAESKAPMIDFLEQEGYVYSQNNYGWSKRPYDYVEIRVKDDNEDNADAWLENVFVSVTDLEGNDISTKDTVKFAHKIHADNVSEETDPTDASKYTYVSLGEFDTYGTTYGYDVIDEDGLVEKLARDKEGYIHLGYVRVAESAKINITVFDKAKDENADYSGNKLTATWTTRIDRTAPLIDIFELEKCSDDSYALLLRASDDESGLAPMWGDDDFTEVYNKYHKIGESFLYKWNDDSDGTSDIYDKYTEEKGLINPRQYELPGLQYALLEEGDSIEDIEPWEFETDPNRPVGAKDAFSAEGYYRDEFEKTKVWHNYNSAVTPVVSSDFDGYIVVRAIDRAGNITVMGYAPTLDITADDDWKNDTQYINVKALDINGDAIDRVEYYGNNRLLYPESAKREITAEALSGEGAFIEVVEEGITKVIVKASKSYAEEKNITLGESGLRNDIWEGNLVLGNPTATGYTDWKYQITDVKIDKTAPEFEFKVYGDTVAEKNKELAETDVAVGPISVEVVNASDPIPNEDKEDMSHIASGIKTIEWCAIPEGSEEEIWKDYNEDTRDVSLTNFTGTIKVRVTDNAGNVTEKSRRIKIDSATPIISISKSNDEKCSHAPIDIFVTVSESAEFSDIKTVTYKVTKDGTEVEDFYHKDSKGNRSKELPLTGGTISIDKSGDYVVTVTAINKAGVEVSKEIEAKVHLDDLTMPTINGMRYDSTEEEAIKSGDWVASNAITLVNNEKNMSDTVIWYSLNGAEWKANSVTPIGKLDPGQNTIRIQTKTLENGCGCESDVNTYVIHYDNGVAPKISVIYDDNSDTYWHKDTADASIVANIGDSASEIRSITYQLGSNTATDDEYYLGKEGGTIILQEEGSWEVSKIVVTMESGIKYYLNESQELVAFKDSIPDDFWKKVVARIDRTAPNVVASLSDGSEDATLFGITGEVDARKKKDLSITVDDLDEHGSSKVKSVEYAIVEKGAQPEWIKVAPFTEGVPVSIKNAISKAFDGTVMVRAIDNAGNETVLTRNVFTEGIIPEVAVSAPSDWQTEDFMVKVDVVDKGLSSEIKRVNYKFYEGVLSDTVVEGKLKAETAFTKAETLISTGGSIEVTKEGEYTLGIIVEDYAGNIATSAVVVKLDKTAPKYSRMIELLGVYNEHEIPASEWNIIHDGWTYNHEVSLEGIEDSHSGMKKVNVKFTSADGATTETTLNSHQTSSRFSESGKYELTLVDNAGNVRNISFAIDKTLQNVINVVGVDEVGKLHIAVTDGDQMLSFYKRENSEYRFSQMYNGVTNQLVDGKTGVRYIYGQNDYGQKSNTLYVIVAPSTEYGVSLLTLGAAPNRYLDIVADGTVSVKKLDEIFKPGINKDMTVGSMLEINEDGVYSITAND